jgi:hypothetical protein
VLDVLLPRDRRFGAAGVGGYGGSSVYHTDKLLRLSQDLPIILEVIEAQERIDQILPQPDEMVEGGLITLENCASSCIAPLSDDCNYSLYAVACTLLPCAGNGAKTILA